MNDPRPASRLCADKPQPIGVGDEDLGAAVHAQVEAARALRTCGKLVVDVLDVGPRDHGKIHAVRGQRLDELTEPGRIRLPVGNRGSIPVEDHGLEAAVESWAESGGALDWSPQRPSLVPQRFGRVDPRGPHGGQRRCQRDEVDDREHDREVHPGHVEANIRTRAAVTSAITEWLTIRPNSVPTKIAVSAMNDASIRKLSWIIRRLNPIARRIPIRRPPFDRGASADHAESGDADDETEPHEALDQPAERPARGDSVLEQLVEGVGLDAVRQNADSSFLASARASTPGAEVEVEDRRPDAIAEGRPERLPGGRDPRHGERRLIGEHADHLQLQRRTGLRIANQDRN